LAGKKGDHVGAAGRGLWRERQALATRAWESRLLASDRSSAGGLTWPLTRIGLVADIPVAASTTLSSRSPPSFQLARLAVEQFRLDGALGNRSTVLLESLRAAQRIDCWRDSSAWPATGG
jgi:hypothetical protein